MLFLLWVNITGDSEKMLNLFSKIGIKSWRSFYTKINKYTKFIVANLEDVCLGVLWGTTTVCHHEQVSVTEPIYNTFLQSFFQRTYIWLHEVRSQNAKKNGASNTDITWRTPHWTQVLVLLPSGRWRAWKNMFSRTNFSSWLLSFEPLSVQSKTILHRRQSSNLETWRYLPLVRKPLF